MQDNASHSALELGDDGHKHERLAGIERWIFDGLALFLVLFYSYSAVLEPAKADMR